MRVSLDLPGGANFRIVPYPSAAVDVQLVDVYTSIMAQDIETIKEIERQCVGFRVRMMNRMVTSIYDDALSSAGLKPTQFTMLVAVANRDASRPADLAKSLAMDDSTLSRNVDRMCNKGWLKLVPDQDRRSHLIAITESGRALIRKSYPAWQEAQEEVTRRLGADGVAALRSVLRKLRA
jgi:DNA-binding MarR family transcriptional regulator